MQRIAWLTAASVICTAWMAAADQWTAKQVRVIDGFRVPESVVVDPNTGRAFVSNIEAAKDQYWADDGKAFLSLLKPGGTLARLRWVDSRRTAVLHALKGLSLLDGVLYAADNTRVQRFDATTGAHLGILRPAGARRLNDMATDGKSVFVSDTAAGKVQRVHGTGATVIQAPSGVNGITFGAGKMFAVSWTLHEVFELDPSGNGAPRALGVAAGFTNLDGIEVLSDGSLLVSDFNGNKVSVISREGKRVQTLVRLESPADIGLDRQRGLLYVPQFMKDKVAVYRLSRH